MANKFCKRYTWNLLGVIALCIASTMDAAEEHHFQLPDNATGQPVSFVSCPVIQDTSAVPCWFADHGSTRYYLGIQQDIGAAFHPPQLNHRVLVEGRILEGVELCGAPVIHPVTISVLPEIDRACNELLPAIPGIEPPPHERGPGPSNDGLQPRERPEPAPRPEPPFQTREYTVPFTFDSAVMRGTVTRIISQAMDYARYVDTARIEITTNRASSLLSSGQELVEQPHMATVRADALRTIFSEAGFADSQVSITAQPEHLPGDGSEDFLLRKAVIRVIPAL